MQSPTQQELNNQLITATHTGKITNIISIPKVSNEASIKLDVNHADSKGNTLLMIAAKENSADLINSLIFQEAGINHVNKKDHTALASAVMNGNSEAVGELLKTWC